MAAPGAVCMHGPNTRTSTVQQMPDGRRQQRGCIQICSISNIPHGCPGDVKDANIVKHSATRCGCRGARGLLPHLPVHGPVLQGGAQGLLGLLCPRAGGCLISKQAVCKDASSASAATISDIGTQHLIAMPCLHAAGFGSDKDHQHHQRVARQPLNYAAAAAFDTAHPPHSNTARPTAAAAAAAVVRAQRRRRDP
jgi:hypothetical protein